MAITLPATLLGSSRSETTQAMLLVGEVEYALSHGSQGELRDALANLRTARKEDGLRHGDLTAEVLTRIAMSAPPVDAQRLRTEAVQLLSNARADSLSARIARDLLSVGRPDALEGADVDRAPRALAARATLLAATGRRAEAHALLRECPAPVCLRVGVRLLARENRKKALAQYAEGCHRDLEFALEGMMLALQTGPDTPEVVRLIECLTAFQRRDDNERGDGQDYDRGRIHLALGLRALSAKRSTSSAEQLQIARAILGAEYLDAFLDPHAVSNGGGGCFSTNDGARLCVAPSPKLVVLERGT